MVKRKKVGDSFSEGLKKMSKELQLPMTKTSDILGTDLPEIVDRKIIKKGRAGKEMEITFKRRFKL